MSLDNTGEGSGFSFGNFLGGLAGGDPMAMGITSLGLGAVSQGIGALNSYLDQREAEKQLAKLSSTPLPRYSTNPAISRIYGGAMRGVAQPQGFTGGQRAAFNQDIAQGLNAQYNNARSMGGGSLSRAISGSLAGNRLNAYNQMASQDAQLARQYQNAAYSRMLNAANTMQGVQNQNTALDVNRRLQQERLLGQAIASQKNYRRGMLNQFGREFAALGGNFALGSLGLNKKKNKNTGDNTGGDYTFDIGGDYLGGEDFVR